MPASMKMQLKNWQALHNNRVMLKPNLRFVSCMAFGHLMRFTTLPVWLGMHGRSVS